MEIITSQQETIQFGEKKFELICTNYGNVIFVLISDSSLQKIGTLLHVHRGEIEPDADSTYSIHTLLGTDKPEFQVFGRAIGQHILTPGASSQSLLVGCGFLEPDPNIITLLLKTLDSFDVWKDV